jgi:hypothetical protein
MLHLDTWVAFDFYKSFLHWYCAWYNPRYLEIGCLGGDLVASLKTKLAVGVDINTHADWATYLGKAEPGTKEFHQCTSNEFFAKDTRQWDLIFIDGDHSATQVRTDVVNSLEHLEEGGLICMHDTLPPTPSDATPDKCGTAYKIRQDLEVMPGIQTYTFPVTFGLTLVAPIGREWPW